ncbi:MAG: hypothetical protein WCE64_02015, partial [Bacteroidales bacterium]
MAEVRNGTTGVIKNNIFYYHINYHKEKDRCNLLIYNGLTVLKVGVRRLEAMHLPKISFLSGCCSKKTIVHVT